METRPSPSSLSNANGAGTLNGGDATANGGARGVPANKARQNSSARPTYRPLASPVPRQLRLRCCCACLLWLLFFYLPVLVLLAAIVFAALYHPQLPIFHVDSIRLSALNVTSSDLLASQLDLSVAIRNPNEKLAFLYDDLSLFAYCDGVEIGEASFPAFVHGTTNTTVLHFTLSSPGRRVDPEEAANLRNRQKFRLEIDMKTEVRVQIGRFKTERIGIKVLCGDIQVGVDKEKAAAAATSLPDARCRMKLWRKIWNRTL